MAQKYLALGGKEKLKKSDIRFCSELLMVECEVRRWEGKPG